MASSSALLKGIDAVLVDPSFLSVVAEDVLQAAELLKEWCIHEENNEVVIGFTYELLSDLQGALVFPRGRLPLNREKIWQQYFTVRSSSIFISRWTAFLEQASINPTPTLYQQLTNVIFRDLMKENYVIPFQQSSITEGVSVLEGNALRYAASYVVHHVFKGVKKSSHELKRDVTDCLMQLVLGKQEDCEQGTAEEWTNLLDRGGLWHVRETTFQVFNALEEGVRQFLSELSSPAAATGLKAKFVAKLVTNDDVQFHWSIATAAFDVDDTKVHETVLGKITELYITIRGFAYASAWTEQYKQTQKNQHSGQRICVNNFILIKTHSTSINTV